MLDRIIHFFREIKQELKKVSTLSRKEALASTLVVIITVFIISVFLGIVDIGLSRAVRLLIR